MYCQVLTKKVVRIKNLTTRFSDYFTNLIDSLLSKYLILFAIVMRTVLMTCFFCLSARYVMATQGRMLSAKSSSGLSPAYVDMYFSSILCAHFQSHDWIRIICMVEIKNSFLSSSNLSYLLPFDQLILYFF